MDSVFLKACRREKTLYTPVWLMRQAGRYMKSYRALRKKTPFMELCKDPDLACEVTVEAQTKIGADAAIIFSDILLILEPMGLKLDYLKNEGPSIQKPVRDKKAVEALKPAQSEKSLSFVFDALRKTKKSLKKDIALIGFAGAPFTLASYMIEGGSTRDFRRVKTFMKDEGLWRVLMQKITSDTVAYLNAQITAGADAVQLFDSWAGILSAQEYEKYVLPYSSQVFRGIRREVPTIHFGTGTGRFIHLIRRAGGDVIGVDHRIKLDEAWQKIGYDRAVQGNLDPEVLLGSFADIRKETAKVIKHAAGRPGHIFNLGHGVKPETPEKNVIELIKFVHDHTRQKK